MISQSPDDRQFYEARLKFLHDEEARLIAAREEGREVGAAMGSLAGKIQLLQQLLGDAETAVSELLERNSEELSTQLSDLQDRLCSRGG